MNNKVVPIRPRVRPHPATWQINEDENSFALQIELGNDCAVTLTIWKNGDPNTVSLWSADGEFAFCRTDTAPDEQLEAAYGFRFWVGLAAEAAP